MGEPASGANCFWEGLFAPPPERSKSRSFSINSLVSDCAVSRAPASVPPDCAEVVLGAAATGSAGGSSEVGLTPDLRSCCCDGAGDINLASTPNHLNRPLAARLSSKSRADPGELRDRSLDPRREAD